MLADFVRDASKDRGRRQWFSRLWQFQAGEGFFGSQAPLSDSRVARVQPRGLGSHFLQSTLLNQTQVAFPSSWRFRSTTDLERIDRTFEVAAR